MKLSISAPRLLPMTIIVLGAVLVAKTTSLVRSAIDHGQPAAFFTAAWAAGPEKPTSAEKPGEKPGEKQTAKPAPRPAESGQPAKPATVPETSTGSMPDGPPPMTDSEKAVLLELRDRRQELEARESTLTSRESMVAAAERKLSSRIEELQSLQKQLESLDASHRQQENAAWQGLVKVYESMKPRDAAVIFNELGMSVLLAVVDRMKEGKAAAVLAAMAPDKARDVTMQLALLRTRPATAVDAGAKPASNTAPGKPPGAGT